MTLLKHLLKSLQMVLQRKANSSFGLTLIFLLLINYMKIYQATDSGIAMLEELIIHYRNGQSSSFKGKVNEQNLDVSVCVVRED